MTTKLQKCIEILQNEERRLVEYYNKDYKIFRLKLSDHLEYQTKLESLNSAIKCLKIKDPGRRYET